MGERKGTNKYYPPDYDPKKGGLNKFMGTHALRERARKLHLGIIIIRFEMPYNIWCEGCNNHIGMGVRYNAEKTKIGMYYSTPVYQFRMKCHLCDNHFEIKTDPGNLDYVIVSGARRQERRWDPTENGQVVPDDKQVIHKLADDAMFKLEHGVDDQRKMKDVAPSLSKLENLQERWKDDYTANRALRDIFRTRKRELQDKQAKDAEFLKKRSLDIPLLQESEDDTKVASLIRLQPAKSVDERRQEKRSEIDKRSLFPFPLKTTSNEEVEPTEIPVNQSSIKSSDSSQSNLEQRRLSFGIKLKKGANLPPVPSSSKSSAVCSTSTSCESSQQEQVCELDLNYQLKAKASGEDCALRGNKDDTLQTESDSGTALKKQSSGPSPACLLQISEIDNNRTSSSGRISSLVSYSDDSSEHSPSESNGE